MTTNDAANERSGSERVASGCFGKSSVFNVRSSIRTTLQKRSPKIISPLERREKEDGNKNKFVFSVLCVCISLYSRFAGRRSRGEGQDGLQQMHLHDLIPRQRGRRVCVRESELVCIDY